MILRFVFARLIRFYQLFISALLPGACRFTPSCSRYAQDAIAEHGVLRGCMLASRRLLRCHPWGASGFDPVPHTCQKGGMHEK